MSQQQTILRVQSNIIDSVYQTTGTLDINNNNNLTISGSGETINPYILEVIDNIIDVGVGIFYVNGGHGDINYSISGLTENLSYISISYDNITYYKFDEKYGEFSGTISVNSGVYIMVTLVGLSVTGEIFYEPKPVTVYENTNLDLYSEIPIKITKSFNELQDISKRNSDLSIGLLLPGTKNNNIFFENFFDVNVGLLNFDPTKRVPCTILIDNVKHFSGYLKLNKVNVKNSLNEYDVTLYSDIGNVFGLIGNNLLKDLNFEDPEHKMNHYFTTDNIVYSWDKSNLAIQGEPLTYMYPIIHNGYEYSGDTINFSGGTLESQTRFFTSTSPIGSYNNLTDFYNAGGNKYRINSQGTGLVNNQLKPAMSIYHLIKLIFKSYGYTISGDFLNTPWLKTLYMYSYFNTDKSKFSYKLGKTETILPTDVEFILQSYDVYDYVNECDTILTNINKVLVANLVKKGTGIPVKTTEDIIIPVDFVFHPCFGADSFYTDDIIISAGSLTGTTTYPIQFWVDCGYGCPFVNEYSEYLQINSNSPIKENTISRLLPVPTDDNDVIYIEDGMYVNFNDIIDEKIKQIDILSSIAKKFDLVFVVDKEIPNNIIIEPYSYYVGTGNIYDWTDKLSYDKGFTIEPAINYIESSIKFTDMEDGDAGNVEFKNRNNRIYGENIVNNVTDFKSNEKLIQTTFSPMVVRKWDADGTDNVGLPLGINYSSNNKEIDNGDNKTIFYYYSGVKTNPKLFYWLGSFNPFIDKFNEIYDYTKSIKSYQFHIRNSSDTTETHTDTIPVISHSMSLGNINSDDSISILYNCELPQYIDVETFNTFTDKNCYNLFYKNKIDNLFNPNTRFLTGYFNLNLTDIYNLQPNDLIKVGDKYFTWNKINDYDYVNNDLTKVELVQFNNSYKTYPTRYFKYYYCDDNNIVYKLKTDFTNSELVHTNYYFSLQYDYNIGLLGGATGYCSTFITTGNTYLPYYIWETTEADYNSTGISFEYDPFLIGFSGNTNTFPYGSLATYWEGTTMTGVNIFTNCDDFNTKASTYTIPTATSETPLPTPTPVPTPTPTPTPINGAMSGSLLINLKV